MKLIGLIAFLAIIFVGCQKQDICPNSSSSAPQMRSSDNDGLLDDNINDDSDSDDDDLSDDSNGITDPNDVNKGIRTARPRP